MNASESARRYFVGGVDCTDHVKRVVDGFPPLTAEQCDRIATLLRGDTASVHGAVQRTRHERVHYDSDGRVLFVGDVESSLLRHVEIAYVERTEWVPEPEARKLAATAVFGARPGEPAIRYLIDRDDLMWVMPVQHCDNNAIPLPQVRPMGSKPVDV